MSAMVNGSGKTPGHRLMRSRGLCNACFVSDMVRARCRIAVGFGRPVITSAASSNSAHSVLPHFTHPIPTPSDNILRAPILLI